MKILETLKNNYKKRAGESMSLEEYLHKAAKDPSFYASPAERLLKAIGRPQLIDTSETPGLGRIFGNRTIRLYDVFKEIYGLEDVIERIVSFFVHSSQGLEEKNQALCLRGPVGSAKSTIVELLKHLMEQEPFYAIEGSPINESPLGLFSPEMAKELKVSARACDIVPSPWALKRLKEYEGDLSQFRVVKLYPSKSYQIAIVKVEPGDENTQDISMLTGKPDIMQLGSHKQDDPDAYNYCGGLCKSHRGMLDFVEMLKAPLKTLHPLLTALQEHNYTGTESIGPIPYDGLVVSHFNEYEWDKFRNDSKNSALLDRFCIIDVPYNLRRSEEIKIFQKLIKNSELANAPCAPHTYECLANFTVLTKLDVPENSHVVSKMRVYNGENVRNKDPKAKSYQEYKNNAKNQEGFFGVSTREAYKILAETFNYDPQEIAADPIHLFVAIENCLKRNNLPPSLHDTYLAYLNNYVKERFYHKFGKDLQVAFLDYYDDFGQNKFEHYVQRADAWIQDSDFKDPDTGQIINREMLEQDLSSLEKPADISNPKDFRHEVVNFVLRYKANHAGQVPSWKAFAKMKLAIEALLSSKTEDMLPVISFEGQGSQDYQHKHKAFVERMTAMGYTPQQVRRLVNAYIIYRKSSDVN